MSVDEEGLIEAEDGELEEEEGSWEPEGSITEPTLKDQENEKPKKHDKSANHLHSRNNFGDSGKRRESNDRTPYVNGHSPSQDYLESRPSSLQQVGENILDERSCDAGQRESASAESDSAKDERKRRKKEKRKEKKQKREKKRKRSESFEEDDGETLIKKSKPVLASRPSSQDVANPLWCNADELEEGEEKSDDEQHRDTRIPENVQMSASDFIKSQRNLVDRDLSNSRNEKSKNSPRYSRERDSYNERERSNSRSSGRRDLDDRNQRPRKTRWSPAAHSSDERSDSRKRDGRSKGNSRGKSQSRSGSSGEDEEVLKRENSDNDSKTRSKSGWSRSSRNSPAPSPAPAPLAKFKRRGFHEDHDQPVGSPPESLTKQDDYAATLSEYFSNQEKEKVSTKKRKKVEKRGVEKSEVETPYHENKRLCFFFRKGFCKQGPDCDFSHDCVQDIEKTMDVCRPYMHGNCKWGEECNMLHGQFPCKYHAKGLVCYKGDRCLFSHDKPTPFTLQLLEDWLTTNPRHISQQHIMLVQQQQQHQQYLGSGPHYSAPPQPPNRNNQSQNFHNQYNNHNNIPTSSNKIPILSKPKLPPKWSEHPPENQREADSGFDAERDHNVPLEDKDDRFDETPAPVHPNNVPDNRRGPNQFGNQPLDNNGKQPPQNFNSFHGHNQMQRPTHPGMQRFSVPGMPPVSQAPPHHGNQMPGKFEPNHRGPPPNNFGFNPHNPGNRGPPPNMQMSQNYNNQFSNNAYPNTSYANTNNMNTPPRGPPQPHMGGPPMHQGFNPRGLYPNNSSNMPPHYNGPNNQNSNMGPPQRMQGPMGFNNYNGPPGPGFMGNNGPPNSAGPMQGGPPPGVFMTPGGQPRMPIIPGVPLSQNTGNPLMNTPPQFNNQQNSFASPVEHQSQPPDDSIERLVKVMVEPEVNSELKPDEEITKKPDGPKLRIETLVSDSAVKQATLMKTPTTPTPVLHKDTQLIPVELLDSSLSDPRLAKGFIASSIYHSIASSPSFNFQIHTLATADDGTFVSCSDLIPWKAPFKIDSTSFLLSKLTIDPLLNSQSSNMSQSTLASPKPSTPIRPTDPRKRAGASKTNNPILSPQSSVDQKTPVFESPSDSDITNPFTFQAPLSPGLQRGLVSDAEKPPNSPDFALDIYNRVQRSEDQLEIEKPSASPTNVPENEEVIPISTTESYSSASGLAPFVLPSENLSPTKADDLENSPESSRLNANKPKASLSIAEYMKRRKSKPNDSYNEDDKRDSGDDCSRNTGNVENEGSDDSMPGSEGKGYLDSETPSMPSIRDLFKDPTASPFG